MARKTAVEMLQKRSRQESECGDEVEDAVSAPVAAEVVTNAIDDVEDTEVGTKDDTLTMREKQRIDDMLERRFCKAKTCSCLTAGGCKFWTTNKDEMKEHKSNPQHAHLANMVDVLQM